MSSKVTIRIDRELHRFVQELAQRLGMTENDVYVLAVRILQLVVRGITLRDLKIYVEPKLLKWLYENSVEYRKVLMDICREVGYVV